jgi:hypothetical protein
MTVARRATFLLGEPHMGKITIILKDTEADHTAEYEVADGAIDHLLCPAARRQASLPPA